MSTSFELTRVAKPKACGSCPLKENHSVQVTTETHGDSTRILFIAEAPGKVEDQKSRPVVGPTGLILRRLVKLLNDGTEEGIAYGNVVRCRPTLKGDTSKDRTPTTHEIDCCKRFILRDIERLNPQYIVLLGNPSMYGLATDPRTDSPIGQEMGGIMKLRGLDYVVKTPNGKVYPALTAYHFAYIARNPSAAGLWKEDIEKAFIRTSPSFVDYSKRGKPAKILTTIARVKKFLTKLTTGLTKDHIVAMDYETDSLSKLDPPKMLCIGFSYGPNTSFVIPMEHPESPWTGKELRKLKKLFCKFFTSKQVSFGALVAHNLKFEAAVTKSYFGVSLCNMPVECTFLRAHALNENRTILKKGAFGLKSLAEEWLQFYHYHDADIEPVVDLRDKGELPKAALLPLCEYNAIDCYAEWRLYQYESFIAKLHKRSASFRKLSRLLTGPASVFAAKLERDGIRANKKVFRYLMGPSSPVLQAMASLEKEMYALPSFKKANRLMLKETSSTVGTMKSLWKKTEVARPWVFGLRSPKAKKLLFFDVLGLKPLSYTPKKTPQINDKLYEFYADVHEIDLFSKWQDYEKLRNTYIEGVYQRLQNDPDMRDGRVRGQLNLGKTVTGRTSFENPNMQNIPRGKTKEAKEIKRLYIAAPGRLIVALDYSQAEVRWMAEVAQDKKLIREFKQVSRIIAETEANPTAANALRRVVEGDFHVRTASQIFKVKPTEVTKQQRSLSKNVVFGNIYGMGLKTLSNAIGCSREEAQKFQDRFFAQFPGASKWLTDIENFAFTHGFVDSPLGRRRNLTANFLLGLDFFKNKRREARYGGGSKRTGLEDDLSGLKAYEDRAARNSPIQVVASDTNLKAGIELTRYIENNNKDWYLINVVHDSIMADIPFGEVEEFVDLAKNTMQSPTLFADFGYFPKVPFIADVSVGVNWGDQFDIAPVKMWKVTCGKTIKGEPCKGGDAFETFPKRCPKCGSRHNLKREFVGGPLPVVLKRLNKEFGFTEEN